MRQGENDDHQHFCLTPDHHCLSSTSASEVVVITVPVSAMVSIVAEIGLHHHSAEWPI